MSERTGLLKERMVFKPVNVRKVDTQGRVIPKLGYGQCKISLERAKLISESDKATEGEPMAIRRAKSLSHLLENMTIYIDEGELIVGNYAPTPYHLTTHVEVSFKWLGKAMNNGYNDMVTDEDRKEYDELAKYWDGKTIADRTLKVLPKSLLDYTSYNGVGWASAFDYSRPNDVPDIEKVLKNGFKGIGDQIKAILAEIEADESLDPKEYIEQRDNLEAMLIAINGAVNFAKRYSALAREMAATEKNEKRKAELEKIAEACEWVPANPARTLHEAIQCYYFCVLIAKQIESTEGCGLGHRLDIYMNPFHQRDKIEKRITKEEAQELVECLFIKLCEFQFLYTPSKLQATGGGKGETKYITICGVTPEGSDATNEFSFIILDAAEALHIPEPSIALRYHPRIDLHIISRAIDVVRTGIGYPAFYNDSAYTTLLLSQGWPIDKARDYGIATCVHGCVCGEIYHSTNPHMGAINLSKCLELALYQGQDQDKFTGKQLGLKTPDLRNATRIEEVTDAYLKQVGYVAGKIARIENIRQTFIAKYKPRPFTSVLLNGCIETGTDCGSRSAKQGEMILLFTGSTNVVNSLAAIKKFVFDEKVISMEDLIEACRTNFEGKEELRQMLIEKAPKFGNDDDYVDDLARKVHVGSNAELGKIKDRFGHPCYLDGGISGGYFAASTLCGALPDGKKDGEPTADASCSPSAGTDKSGPTAVLNSVSKIPYTYKYLFNQKFLPRFLEGANKEIFAQYLKAWCDLGIGHIQFNVIDRDTLIDAQSHPEKYRNLVIRVAGYSAYFVDLPKALQDDIIRRTEQGF